VDYRRELEGMTLVSTRGRSSPLVEHAECVACAGGCRDAADRVLIVDAAHSGPRRLRRVQIVDQLEAKDLWSRGRSGRYYQNGKTNASALRKLHKKDCADLQHGRGLGHPLPSW
jgi:hypothetical protein